MFFLSFRKTAEPVLCLGTALAGGLISFIIPLCCFCYLLFAETQDVFIINLFYLRYIFLIPAFTVPIAEFPGKSRFGIILEIHGIISIQILSVFRGRDNHNLSDWSIRLYLCTGTQREDGKAVFSADSAFLHKPEGLGFLRSFLLNKKLHFGMQLGVKVTASYSE